jgi:glycerol-3-phosphate acyltransferase PlsY
MTLLVVLSVELVQLPSDVVSGTSIHVPVRINSIGSFLIAAIIIWSHRSNIKRLWQHNERKTYFFKKKPAASAEVTGKEDNDE